MQLDGEGQVTEHAQWHTHAHMHILVQSGGLSVAGIVRAKDR